MKLASTLNTPVHVSIMKDGDIAVIQKEWTMCEGRIVQRVDDRLISLGEGYGKSWPTLFETPFHENNHKHMLVIILPKGTLLEV